MPPFFIPILAFILWTLALLAHSPVLKFDLAATDPLLAAQFFIGLAILILSWAFSGPVMAVTLTVLASVVSVYISLQAKEPAILLEPVIYAALFVFMVFYLYRVQNRTNDKAIHREKLVEEIHLTEEEIRHQSEVERSLERKIDRFLDLQRFSEELKGLPELETASRTFVEEVRRVLGDCDECALYLVQETEGPRLALSAGTRLSPEGVSVKQKEGSIFDQWVMKRSQGLMIEDAQNDFRFSIETRAGIEGIRSVCASPLVTENKVLGVIRASSPKPSAFDTDDLRLLDHYASLAAVTLRNILLYQKMGELAIRDSLTGLYLNRYFQKRLSEEMLRSAMNKASFSVLLLDIDHFKRYNDEYGHAAGDIVLKNIAAILQSSVSKSDLVARYGGEEFVILLPGKTAKEAAAAAEKIRAKIESAVFVFRRIEGRVTASIGVASYPDSGPTSEALLWKVDHFLYEAKNGGRNRVCGSS